MLTNRDGAENFSLAVTPTDTPSQDHWTTVLPHRGDVRLDDVDAFAGNLVIAERAEGLERLRVLPLADDGAVGDGVAIATEESVASIWIGANPEFDTSLVRYGYTSLVTPPSSYDYDVATRESTLVKRQPVAGYEPSQYATERLWATAADGTRVPISVV